VRPDMPWCACSLKSYRVPMLVDVVCLNGDACSNRVLSSSGQLGVPRVEKPHVTEPKPFNLRSDSRARVRRSHEQPTMQQAAVAAHFKAQPLNRSILDGPVRVAEKHVLWRTGALHACWHHLHAVGIGCACNRACCMQ
jgi:hypothetical protein